MNNGAFRSSKKNKMIKNFKNKQKQPTQKH